MNTHYLSLVPRFQFLPRVFHVGSVMPGILMFILVSVLLLGSMAAHAQAVSDPFEPVNRATLRVNRVLDTILFKPVAKTYQQLTPRIVKSGVRNFFSNLGEIGVIANDVLQGQLADAAVDLTRFTVNTTVGIGGLFEVADPALGLEKREQDFGQTLSVWGVESGPYVVLPVFGPSTVRDAFGFGVDSLLNPVTRHDETSVRDPLLITNSVDTRARYLPVDDLIFGDEYLFLRDLYLQHRQFQLDGESMDLAFEEF